VGQKREKAGALLVPSSQPVFQSALTYKRELFSLFITMTAEGRWTGRAVEITVAVRETERDGEIA
jgi:hypothetical protein